MKVNIVTKRIATIILSFLLLQYVSIIFPVLHVNAKIESMDDTVQIDEQENEICITKDESMLNINKVNINIKVPENTYTVILPDGNSSIDSNLTFEVTKNGQYIFEFIDIQGNSKYRIVHINTIQNRKLTKVPRVTASNGKIKLESDCTIEYSIDNKNWEEYEKELDYKEPILARVVDEDFECSIIKITLKQNGELDVENTESREIYGEILNNVNSEIINTINDKKSKNSANGGNDTSNKNISNVNIEYSLVYKEDVNVDYKRSTEEEENKKVENGEIYKFKQINSEDEKKNFWKETHIKYAYIDSNGNLISNIQLINKAKEEIEKIAPKIKYEKIVGNKEEFYILTEEAEVYYISTEEDVINSELPENLKLIQLNDDSKYLLAKLNVKNIINIYDSYTALTKDGEIVSIAKNGEEKANVIKELQGKTDKYLVQSHIGIKDGKLYNFDNAEDGKELIYGKLIITDEAGLGIYSASKDKINLFEHDSNGELIIPELGEDDVFVNIESEKEDLPEFIDIAEYGESSLVEISYLIEGKKVECEDIEQNTKCYAVEKNGEIWAVFGEYIVDTGLNINYFTPTANYTLNNTRWTNESVILNTTENTESQIISIDVKKGEKIINKEDSYKIETNGEYIVTVKDEKQRVYDIIVNVENIDKINPDIAYTGKIENGIANIVAYDKADTLGEFAKSGISKIELTYETPRVDTEWTELEGKINEEGKMYAQVKQIATTKLAYVRTIDNAGNVSTIRKIDFKEDLNEEEQIKQIEEQEKIEIEQNNTQIKEQEFKNSNLFENIDENNSELMYLVVGIIIIMVIGFSMYIKL